MPCPPRRKLKRSWQNKTQNRKKVSRAGDLFLWAIVQICEIFRRFLVLTSEKESSMIRKDSGGIAQLASASDWQSEGQGFKSPYLHH